MDYEMAIALHFFKKDNSPWGFHIEGGADHDFPPTIVKITEGSPAEKGGLKVGDVLCKIQNEVVNNLTNQQVQKKLLHLNQEFSAEIFRNQVTDKQANLESKSKSIQEVYKVSEYLVPIGHKSDCSEKHDLNLTDEEIHSIINPENFISSEQKCIEDQNQTFYVANTDVRSESYYIHNIDRQVGQYNLIKDFKENEVDIYQSEVLKAINNCLNNVEKEERKWSTFLQKPKNTKPKTINDGDKLGANQYRVVIRTKKDLENERAAKRASEVAAMVVADELIKQEEITKQTDLVAEDELNEHISNVETLKHFDVINTEIGNFDNTHQEKNYKNNIIEANREIESDESKNSEENIKHVTSRQNSSLTIEQQLAEVKEQLLALSDLPETIQMTLSLITQQLQKIAHDNQPYNEEPSYPENTDTEDDITELAILESEKDLSAVEEETDNKDTTQDFLLEEQVCFEDLKMGERSEDIQEEINIIEEDVGSEISEEIERKRIEQQKIDKKMKDMEEYRSFTPLERPIILPGGRKWSHPDDAVRSVRHPKMSDDKIDQTISSYYEVVTGHTIGESNCCLVPSKVTEKGKINFLKYQPPPKNLDHLQRSEVYKIIHDLEPPARGILARSEMILSEEDYFAKNNGNENENMPPQMER